MLIPRLYNEVSLTGSLLKIPQPDTRIQPETQRRSAFRSLAFVGLRFLAAYKLLGIFESILDAPSARKTSYHLGSSKTQIRGKEKVVLLLACRVSTDYQKHWFLRYPVPYNFSGIYKAFSSLASFASFDKPEVVNSFGHLFGGWQLFAFLARASWAFAPGRWRRGIQVRIGIEAADQRQTRMVLIGEASQFVRPKAAIAAYVKTVPKLIVDGIGGTEFGPAASFRDIVRAIVHDTHDTLAVATPTTFTGIPEPVFVSVPTQLGRAIGSTLYPRLPDNEQQGIADAAEAIYTTFTTAQEHLDET